MIRLESWSLHLGRSMDDDAPEFLTTHLQGTVFGHPEFQDRERIVTSAVSDVEVTSAGVTVKTRSGTEYVLGQVCVVYEELFPNAIERLLSLSKGERNVV